MTFNLEMILIHGFNYWRI